MDPSPGPWVFHTHVYGLPNVLLDRDGRVISCHLPTGNGVFGGESTRDGRDPLAGAAPERQFACRQ